MGGHKHFGRVGVAIKQGEIFAREGRFARPLPDVVGAKKDKKQGKRMLPVRFLAGLKGERVRIAHVELALKSGAARAKV